MTAETLRHDTYNVSSGRPFVNRELADAVQAIAPGLRLDLRPGQQSGPGDDPFEPVIVRGRVAEWLEGDEAWEIIDQLSTKYIGAPYPREQERVVAVIEPEHQTVGVR